MDSHHGHSSTRHVPLRLARLVFITFLLTFACARMVVFLIMSGKMPILYLYMGGAHIHHLNYGILILAVLGGYLLFKRPLGYAADVAAVSYGIGMALTFDEFGMWVNLGGPYWQRASWNAVAILAAVFGMITFAPKFNRFRVHHWVGATVVALGVGIFCFIVFKSLESAHEILGPKLQELEALAPK